MCQSKSVRENYVLNILLAEDNPGDVFLVRRALAEHHISHTLHVVSDGQQALDFAHDMGKQGVPCPDLLLLDINLPKYGGAEVLAEFRKHPECADMPVIVVTSSDASSDRHKMAAIGIDGYFRKPSELTAFMTLGGVVRDVVQSKSA
jgi:chemotaxis family two-component system response regulator Rcp1